jgi:hypothetical protein
MALDLLRRLALAAPEPLGQTCTSGPAKQGRP